MTLVVLLLFAAAAQPPADELASIEKRFYEDWKAKKLDGFQKNLASDAIAWGEFGAFSKQQQLDFQRQAEANCDVKSFNLSGFEAKPVAKDVVILMYRVEQDATCGGGKVDSPLRNATVYVKRKGQWQVVFRATHAWKEMK